VVGRTIRRRVLATGRAAIAAPAALASDEADMRVLKSGLPVATSTDSASVATTAPEPLS
jgi:hypothetical protein